MGAMYRLVREVLGFVDVHELILPLDTLQKFLVVLLSYFAIRGDASSYDMWSGFALITTFIVLACGEALRDLLSDNAPVKKSKWDKNTSFITYMNMTFAYRVLVIMTIATTSGIALRVTDADKIADGAPVWVSLSITVVLWVISWLTPIKLFEVPAMLIFSSIAELFLVCAFTSTQYNSDYPDVAKGVLGLALLLTIMQFYAAGQGIVVAEEGASHANGDGGMELVDFAEIMRPIEQVQKYFVVMLTLFAMDHDNITLWNAIALISVLLINSAGDALRNFLTNDPAHEKKSTYLKDYMRCLLAYRIAIILIMKATSTTLSLNSDAAPVWTSLAITIFTWAIAGHPKIVGFSFRLQLLFTMSAVAELLLLFSFSSTYSAPHSASSIGFSFMSVFLVCLQAIVAWQGMRLSPLVQSTIDGEVLLPSQTTSQSGVVHANGGGGGGKHSEGERASLLAH